MERLQRIAFGSIGVGLAVLILKGVAWWITGSAALYSDALESVINVATAVLTVVALRYADKPADAGHPYGHDKVEYFAAVIEGVLVVLAALSILSHAWFVWRHARPIDVPLQGIGLNAVATLVNFSWAFLLAREGARAHSPALSADATHLRTDVVTSAGVIVGVLATVFAGVPWLDPLVAALVAVYVFISGSRILRASVGGLMDEAPSTEVLERIRGVVASHASGALEAHDLRTRVTGRHIFLEFHLVVPGEMRVADAHAICDRIEEALRAEIDNLVVTIHVEPEAKAKQHGVLVL